MNDLIAWENIELALNMELVRAHGLTQREVKKLTVLHELMDSLVDQQNWYHELIGLSKSDRKALRKIVRQMEYMMQHFWGFDEDKSKHYHHNRFDALRKREKITRTL